MAAATRDRRRARRLRSWLVAGADGARAGAAGPSLTAKLPVSHAYLRRRDNIK